MPLLACLGFELGLGTNSFAAAGAKISFSDDSARVTNLTINMDPPNVIEDPQPDGSRFVAVVTGKFTTPYWTLLLGRDVIPLDNDGKFEAKVPIIDNTSTAVFVGVGPLGEIERQVMVIYADMAGLNLKAEKSQTDLTAPQMNVGLGFSNLSYSETGTTSNPLLNPSGNYSLKYSEIVLTAKFGLTKRFEDSNWVFGLTSYLNLFPISKNQPETVRFLGVNLRAGYTIPKIQDPWRLTIYGGFYYITMLTTQNANVNGGNFGFQNVGGPQLYPVLTRALPGNKTISAYLKYSPISDDLSFQGGSHEIAGGLIYSMPYGDSHTLALTLDISSLSLTVSTVDDFGNNETSYHSSSTISLGVSYGF